MPFQLFRIRRPEFRHCGSNMAFGSLLILSASAFGADRPTEDIWSVRTMGIWSEPYENDLRILTNGDELELGFDDSFGFSAAIGWQPKGFAFGFELEYRSTEHDLVSGNLPELGTIEADATRSVETIFLNAVARQKRGLDITIFGGVGLDYHSWRFRRISPDRTGVEESTHQGA